MDDSTQRTGSKSPSYQNASVEIVVSIRRNWKTQTRSHCLVASGAADALSHLTFLTFLRLQDCMWSDTTKTKLQARDRLETVVRASATKMEKKQSGL